MHVAVHVAVHGGEEDGVEERVKRIMLYRWLMERFLDVIVLPLVSLGSVPVLSRLPRDGPECIITLHGMRLV